MINIEDGKKEFMEYINKVKVDNPREERKIHHSFRVMQNCKKIATELNLEEEQIKLAQLIGLLHDIGRFEQYKKFKKNIDTGTLDKNINFDHAQAGVEILKKDNYIRKYIKEDKYDNIIFKAIYEHNKYELSDNLNQDEQLFCKIVKDADKIDIIYEEIYIYWQEDEQIKKIEEGKISKKVLEGFYLGKLCNNKDCITEIDQIIKVLSFIYDINFKCSFKILNENNNLNKTIDRFNYKLPDTKFEMLKAKEIANEYIRQKIK